MNLDTTIYENLKKIFDDFNGITIIAKGLNKNTLYLSVDLFAPTTELVKIIENATNFCEMNEYSIEIIVS